jgi:hypothetical protein
MADFSLTNGPDTINGTSGDDTVNGTAATLNAGDQLTGAAGTDVLALYGSGTFHVDQLAVFTGFEGITLNNFTNGPAFLYLGNQAIAVSGFGSGTDYVYLGSGATTIHGGGGGNYIFSASAANWNAGNAIDGSQSLYLYLNANGITNATYDLTTNTLTHLNLLNGSGDNLKVKINSANASGILNFSGSGANDQLITSDSTLDLSHSQVTGFTVGTTNATGTTFTVQDLGTAFQIAGGTGQDTITTQAFAFTAAQRNAIFATASIEKIIDASGTYTKTGQPPINHPPSITSNGGGDTAAVLIPENTTAVTTVVATDPDAGTTLAYSISGGADAALFQINASTGALSFKAAPNFEQPTDADHNNSYVVQVTASDGASGDNQIITVNVADVPDTAPPHWIASADIGTHPAGYLPISTGDFNHDATSDVLWFNASNLDVDLWKLSNARWAGSQDIGLHPASYQPALSGDFNNDGTADVFWFNPTTGDTDVWKIANGQWAGSSTIGLHPLGWQPAGSGDFNADGTSDVLWFNPTTHDAEIWKVQNGQWAGSVDIGIHPAGYTPSGIGDFDHDGTSDVFWFNSTTGDTDIWKLVDGHWAGSTTIGVHPAGYAPVGVGDFNQDGTSDVVWFNATTGNIDIWLVQNGHWIASVDLGNHPLGWSPAGLGDFDHNGSTDILWRDAAGTHVEAWLLSNS